jgi:hypothetical protein
MRTEVLDYINSLALGGFLLTQELPWEADGTTLYVKNLKKIYVDVPEYQNEPIIQTLNGININNETTIIRIYFACDAKQIPTNYETLISDLKLAKDITSIEGIQRRQCDINTSMDGDVLVTQLEIRFTKLST